MNRKKGIEAKKSGKSINKESQTKKLKEEIGKMQNIEDSTKYGEFVSSYFAWITLDGQKEKAKELEDITDQ